MKLKHIKALCQKMRDYFVSYEGIGAPSFEKFAAMMSLSTLELRDLRSVPEFEAAYRECCAIRRDYLIDRGLEKKFDSSLVKLLITTEKEDDLCVDGAQFTLSVEVVEREKAESEGKPYIPPEEDLDLIEVDIPEEYTHALALLSAYYYKVAENSATAQGFKADYERVLKGLDECGYEELDSSYHLEIGWA